jgi:2-oxoglutarate ferredoxin oxidoreductase subunit gamma
MCPENVHEKIICAGFGGQGIMFLGKLLAQAGMAEGLAVTYLPSYGAEVRGGTAHCNVIASSDEIASPVIGRATGEIMMNHPSLVKFEPTLCPGGLLVVNASLTLEPPRRDDIEVIAVPATEIADSLGNTQVANMVALGCFLRKRPFVSLSTVLDCLEEVLPERRRHLLDVNREALQKGVDFEPRRDEGRKARG